MKPRRSVTSLKTDGAVFDSVQPIPLLPLLKTHCLPKGSMQPDQDLADINTHGLSIEPVKTKEVVASLKTTGDLLECSLENDTPSKQVAQHTCDAIATMKPKSGMHRTYNATGFEA